MELLSSLSGMEIFGGVDYWIGKISATLPSEWI